MLERSSRMLAVVIPAVVVREQKRTFRQGISGLEHGDRCEEQAGKHGVGSLHRRSLAVVHPLAEAGGIARSMALPQPPPTA
jgi:hypothetical protein